MKTIWGIVLCILGGIAWIGQLISALWPAIAERLTITETPDAVDPAFYVDIRAEAFWDIAILWVLPAAGILLMTGNGRQSIENRLIAGH